MDHIWINANCNHMKLMAAKWKKEKIDNDCKVYCNYKQCACWKYPPELMIVFVSHRHTFEYTLVHVQYTCIDLYVHAQSFGGFTFPGMTTILILLYTEVKKRACSQSLLPIAVAILLSCRVKIWGWEYESTVLQIYATQAGQKLLCKTTSAFLVPLDSLNSTEC